MGTTHSVERRTVGEHQSNIGEKFVQTGVRIQFLSDRSQIDRARDDFVVTDALKRGATG